MLQWRYAMESLLDAARGLRTRRRVSAMVRAVAAAAGGGCRRLLGEIVTVAFSQRQSCCGIHTLGKRVLAGISTAREGDFDLQRRRGGVTSG